MNISFSKMYHNDKEFLSIGRLTLLPNTPLDKILDFQNKIERVDPEYFSVFDARSFSSWTGISEESLEEIRVGGEKTFYHKEVRVIRLTEDFFVGEHVKVLFNYNYNYNTNRTINENHEVESHEEHCGELICN